MAYAGAYARITRMVEKPPAPKVRNVRTQASHRREVLWQIAVPSGLAAVAAVAWMILVASPQGYESRSALADVSVIFLIIPAAMWGVALLALLVGMCVGAWYLLRELPYLFKQAQDYAALAAHYAKVGTGRVAGGVMSVQSFVAAVQKTLDDIRSLFTFRRRR